MVDHSTLPTIGWREWIALPALGVSAIKAKIDTGARTSCLHAFGIKEFQRRRKTWVRFQVHPLQRDLDTLVTAEAELCEYRYVRSSTGHLTRRPVICTEIEFLGASWPIELTLTARDEMGFRMLLGREAVRSHCLVDAGRSYLWGRDPLAETSRATSPGKVNGRRPARRASHSRKLP